MKKILIIFCLCFFSINVAAQEKAKEVPFMPYVQGDATSVSTSSRLQPFSNSQEQKDFKTTIFFAPNSDTIKKQNIPSLKEVVERVRKNGTFIMHITAYKTPEMSDDIANNRISAVWEALKELGLPQTNAIFKTKTRVDSLISIDRVEIVENNS